MKLKTVVLVGALLTANAGGADSVNLVVNGSFEESKAKPGVPDAWVSAGNPAVHQHPLLDTGRDGKACAKLECTEFAGDGPDFHAMICQVGKVGVRKGQWYRITFWAKGQGIPGGAVEVALSNMRPWDNAGLAEACSVRAQWQRFEYVFRAKSDLPAATSRLQFWFKSTGTLWLDDVELSESTDGQQWFPQMGSDGVKNFIPNSSFECGDANWGSFTWGLSGWAGNLYRFEGQLDRTVAHHGQHGLRIALSSDTLPVFWFDYYEPIRQLVRRVLVANQGWFRVKPGEPLTLSAYLRADTDGVVAQLAANEAPSRLSRKEVAVGKQWQRYEFTFAPAQPFFFIAVGLDLEASKRDAATLWVDAIQLERGERATAYEPRQAVESFIETGVPGNVFTNVAKGAAWTVRAFNDATTEQTVQGTLAVTDFFERTNFTSRPTLRLPACSGASLTVTGACPGRRGFFRADWMTDSATSSLRCALLEPVDTQATDSPFGFNHAYPWDFLVRQARAAGIVWWRDWSAKWQTVEPEKGRFDFAAADEQIHRILKLDSEVEVLLPFPSATWSTTARPEDVDQAAGRDAYLRARLPLAYAPKNLDDFGRYAAEVVRRYHRAQPRTVTHYQILNEPVYTSYALPRQFGYRLSDYLRLLETAWHAMKKADPSCRIVGGISANVDAGLTRDFIAQGGLNFVDVLDLHMYDPARPAESYERSFRSLAELMRAHGGPKPLWITEWGCYADDDPACVPQTVGDATMNRCRWPSERAATEHLVKFAAVTFTHGVRKIFFHAGTCGPINGPDAGGVLFEYGGTPRKMYAGVSALTRILGVPDECVKRLHGDGLEACVFRVKQRIVAVVWCTEGQTRPLKLRTGVTGYDVMGNELSTENGPLGESPVYLEGADVDAILQSLER